VSGLIGDGGTAGGTGASLVKVGPGTLALSHAGNTYSGGTTLEDGVLDLAAVGAAGTGDYFFRHSGAKNREHGASQ
jgi:autotransporter-associated beta strand protein